MVRITKSDRNQEHLIKYASILLTLLLAVPAHAQHGQGPARPARAYTTAPIPATEVGAWRADLQQLLRELDTLHAQPYRVTTRAQLEAAASQLSARIPKLAAHEIIVELERITAMVGDGHTNINLVNAAGVDFRQLPIRFGLYQDGLYIEAADRRHADMVGARVINIGNLPADSALARLTPIISRDNDQWITVAAPQLLNLAEVLHALRLTDRLDRVTLTLLKDGRTQTADLTPLPLGRPRPYGYPMLQRYTDDWVDARDAATAPVPLYQQRIDDTYWWHYEAPQRLLYIKWDQVANRQQGETALAMFRAALTYARQNSGSIDKVLLDLRNNTGGEGGLLDPIVREIIRTREVDEPGRFFVAIGPRTFSAALLMSASLERFARPVFVGEPTGGKPVVSAGHVFARLRNSGISVSVSPLVYQSGMRPDDPRPWIAPRVFVRPTFADYVANRDPLIDAVLAYRPDALVAELRPLIMRGDTIAAAARLRAHGADPANKFYGASIQANALGYQFLGAGDTINALRTFRLNVAVHPHYTNGWDSLGEAYADAGMVEDAIVAFEKVLAVEPDNGRARDFLHRLKQRRGT